MAAIRRCIDDAEIIKGAETLGADQLQLPRLLGLLECCARKKVCGVQGKSFVLMGTLR